MIRLALAAALAIACTTPLVSAHASTLNNSERFARISSYNPKLPCTKCGGLINHLNPGDLVTLNPQPLPPRVARGGIIFQ
jgi:hypothetical protein